MFDTVIARLPHDVFENQIASTVPLDDLDSSRISELFRDCVVLEYEKSFFEGKMEVGQTVKYLEPPCPMDNCNQWCCNDPVSVEIVWLGSFDEGYKLFEQEPAYDIWYYIQ